MIHLNPPPAVTPKYAPFYCEISQEALHPFLNFCTCLWLKNGKQFWFYPIEIGPIYMYGFVWQGGCWIKGSARLTAVESVY